MKTIVFLGPSLDVETARTLLEADYRPPVVQGDVISAVISDRPDVIAIADGVVKEDYAVWHKELLFALEKGVTLFGAAGIGALRAVEIPQMTGVGTVYHWFRDEHLETNDAVQCVWTQSGHACTRTSEPLVNIRATLDAALHSEILSERERDLLLTIAQSRYYPDRSFAKIFSEAESQGMDTAALSEAMKFARDHYVDIQRQDVMEMLKTIALLPEEQLGQRISPARRSGFFNRLYERDRKVPSPLGDVRLGQIHNFVTINHPDAEKLFFSASLRKIGITLADYLNISVDDKAVQQELKRFRSSMGLLDDTDWEKWLSENDVIVKDFTHTMADMARLRVLFSMFTCDTGTLLDELRFRGEYPRWKSSSAESEKPAAENQKEIVRQFRDADIKDLLGDQRYYGGYSWHIPAGKVSEESGCTLQSMKWELAKAAVRRSANPPPLKAFFEQMGIGIQKKE